MCGRGRRPPGLDEKGDRELERLVPASYTPLIPVSARLPTAAPDLPPISTLFYPRHTSPPGPASLRDPVFAETPLTAAPSPCASLQNLRCYAEFPASTVKRHEI